ncbi:hypothetical protein AB0B50_03405 [Streptomyces sp. NPDC041068]|uniref:hypothetical protein n=1 Tax=Streptomyces sp. NPDC041068 TaxID=3155130 RepID=UPI0033CCBC98
MSEPFPLHPAFAVTARTGLTAAASRSWSAGLHRGPRLLVPVDVQALVVHEGVEEARADVALRLFDGLARDPSAPGPYAPDPFTPAAPLPPGVHLHWALPDALTHAVADGPGAEPVWPALPDRWVVVRLDHSTGTPRTLQAWALEAEKGGSAELDGWRPGGARAYRTPLLRPDQLTAVCGGDPAWAASYDNVAERFAHHDDWSTVPAQHRTALAYVVVGWYSRPELDPLAAADTPGAFHAALDRLGWQVDTARLVRAQADAERSAAGAEALGRGSADLPPPASVPLAGLFGAGRPAADPQAWWPRQSFFHGVVYGVHADPRTTEDPRPEPGTPRVAIGATSAEALAALVAGELRQPDAEILYQAFAHGLATALGEPDGLARIEEESHARSFVARPGASRVERVATGDPFTDLRPTTPPTPALDRIRRDTAAGVPDFAVGRDTLADLHLLRTRPEHVAPPADPRRTEPVPRPLPRRFHPQDPVLVMRGLRRSLRHGHDGARTPGERLACRLTGDTVTRLAGVIDGRDLLARGLDHGSLPPEADALLVEAAVEDPYADYTEMLGRLSRYGLPLAEVVRRLRAEGAMMVWSLAFPSRAAPLTHLSLKDGKGSSPVGITLWRQAWVPLWCEWEIEWNPHPDAGDWELGELDFAPRPHAGFSRAGAVVLRGRSSLVSAPSHSLGDDISRFLAEEDRLDLRGEGRVDDALENRLRRIAASEGVPDLVSAGFDRLRERMLGFTDDMATTPGVPPAPTGPPHPLRAGFVRLRQLRIVDAYGRTVDLLDPATPLAYVGAGLRGPARDILALPPRVNQPATLSFRLVDAADDGREAAVDQQDGAVSPVAGWLLADHADGAVEFFAPGGRALGQLAHDALSGAVVWEGPPGDRAPWGAPASAAFAGEPRLRHLLGLAEGLIDRDGRERAAGVPRSDTPLDALLRIVDTTATTVGAGGSTGSEHTAQLVGKPIAVVRARLVLDIEPEDDHPALSPAERAQRAAAWAWLAGRPFPVRLGALTRLDDGLLAYFVDDDYGLIRPVHAEVARLATPSGRHRGDFAALGRRSTAARPVRTPSVADASALSLLPGRALRLTLLMDPAAKVHATSGVLPRKSVDLLRDWFAEDLARLVPSVRVGPVLVDPGTIRMPLMPAPDGDRLWTRRTAPLSWRDDPVVAASQQALLPEVSARAQEGCLRLAPEAREAPEDGGAG